MPFTHSTLFIAVSALLLSACGSSGDSAGSTTNNTTQPGPSQLRSVSSSGELENSVRNGLRKQGRSQQTSTRQTQANTQQPDNNNQAAIPEIADMRPDLYADDFLLEQQNADADLVVKGAGHLYLVELERGDFEVLDTAWESQDLEQAISEQDFEHLRPETLPEKQADRIRVMALDTNNHSSREAATITLNDATVFVEGLYHHDADRDTLVAVGSKAELEYWDHWQQPLAWMSGSTQINFYNVTDPAAINVLNTTSIEGHLVQTRQVGDTLYVVTRHTPMIGALDDIGDAQWEQALEGVSAQQMLPEMRRQNTAQQLVQATDCYIPESYADTDGYGVITTVTAFNINTPDTPSSVCYNGDSAGIYMTDNSLYLVDYFHHVSRSAIHKFGLSQQAITYRGSGEVEGDVAVGSEFNFLLHEKDNQLLVLSARYPELPEIDIPAFDENTENDGFDGSTPVADIIDAVPGNLVTDYRLTVLAESEGRLQPQISLSSADNTLAIDNQAFVHGVSFVGNLALIKVFTQNDEVSYVVDLSTPASPQLKGQLALPGFAELVYPVSGELLLTLGYEVPKSAENELAFLQGVKLNAELFDIRNLAAPVSRGKIDLGVLSESEALFDQGAFTFVDNSQSNMPHRIALPVDRYRVSTGQNQQVDIQWQSHQLALLSIANYSDPAAASLSASGSVAIEARSDSRQQPSAWFSRTEIENNSLFHVYNNQVYSAAWTAPDQVDGPR